MAQCLHKKQKGDGLEGEGECLCTTEYRLSIYSSVVVFLIQPEYSNLNSFN